MKRKPVVDKQANPVIRRPQGKAEIGERRRARMRARLLASAARVIADRGDKKATIDDFIKEAKVARGTFYNHFAKREDLLEALWSTIGHDPFAEIQLACRAMPNPLERFAAVTRRVLYQSLANPTWGWLVVALSADKATVNQDLLGYPRPDMKDCEALGLMHYDDLACAADLVIATVRAGIKVLLTEKRAPHYTDSLCKMILLSLGVSRPDSHNISHMPLPERSSADPSHVARGLAKESVMK